MKTLFLLLLGTLCLPAVVSFSVLRQQQRPSAFSRCNHHRLLFPLAATVYSDDYFNNGQVGYSYFDDDDNSNNNMDMNDNFISLMETLSETCKGSLARLACAFEPSDQGLHLQDLASVEVVNVDEHHIDISAVECQNESCVSVLVPVEFPHACFESPNVNECILENIQELDEEAQHRLVAEEQATASALENNILRKALKEEPMAKDLPLWWAFPEGYLFADECYNLKDLLNEPDFENELKVLFATQHPMEEDILHVAVAAVGPSGMLLRAQVDAPAAPTLLDLPIAFAQPATDVDKLRSFVIGLVEG